MDRDLRRVPARARRAHGEEFRAFDPEDDYATFVDGKPRADGVRDFLASRGITLPEGSADDPADQAYEDTTVAGLGNRKNADLLRRIDSDGVDVYEGPGGTCRRARGGLRRAVVSSSANTRRCSR